MDLLGKADATRITVSAGATILATHSTRHFRSSETLRALKPATLLREIRAWMVQFGD